MFRRLLLTSAAMVLAATPPALALDLSAVNPAPSQAPAKPQAGGGDLIRDVRIEGNQRIESRTVLSYLGMTAGSHFNESEIDAGLKNLFATGFFSDVKLLRDGSTLVVRVTENAMINRVAFEGNDKIETKDLEKEVELKARSIYSRDKVQTDVKRILDIYRRSGRYSATVTPKVIKQDQNRVDLVYEITEGPVAKVAKISFIGNEHYDADTLRKTVRTEETRWYKFLSDNDKYDPDRLQFDQDLLRHFYTKQGYADFSVKSAHAELSPNKDSFYITFVVDEGPQYTFGDVKIDNQLKGNQKFDFKDIITTKKGDTYDSSKVEDTIDAMTKDLGTKGYAFVDIQPKLDRDAAKKIATLTYEIKPGPRVYVERINVTGNVRTRDEVIRREFRLAEGDPYNTSQIQRSEQRLNNLGYFDKVNIKNEQGSAPDKTVVNVDVAEKSTGEVNIGAGYSTTDGVLGELGVSENNLLGTGQQVKANVTYGARIKQEEFSYTEPYTFGRELATGFDLYNTRQTLVNENSYASDIKGVTFRGSYALTEKLQHTVDYSIRDNDITDVQPTASVYIQQEEGSDINSSVGHSLAYDNRNSKFNPTSGYYAKLSQEVAGLGGDSYYLKDEIKSSYYYPISPKWVMSFLGSGGYIYGWTTDGVRINDRFFIGGDDLRGFENAGVGPRDTATRDSLGGDAYYIGTAELHFPLGLPEELGVSGAIFSDVGSLWDVSGASNKNQPETVNGITTTSNVFDVNKPRVSGGVGAMWASPFGPIRIDLVHAFIKQQPDLPETIHFSFGTRF